MTENKGSPAESPVDFLSQLKNFDKRSLSKTETKVTTESGTKLVETHNEDGSVSTKVIDKGLDGFVADLCLDLQVGEIRPRLIQASQDVAAEWDILEKYGVTHILNVASYVKNYFPMKIKYLNLKINDDIGFHILPSFDPAFKFIDEGMNEGCVLVHCNAGVSRASTITIGYLMSRENMSLKDAHALVKEKRPACRPNDGFMVQLGSFEKRLRAEKQHA